MPNPIRLHLMIADTAQVAGDKLFVLGGGIRRMPPFSLAALAGIMHLPAERAGTRYIIRVQLVTGDGQAVEVETPEGKVPFELASQLDIARSPDSGTRGELSIPLAFQLAPLPLAPGPYIFRVSIDGEAGGSELPFEVVEPGRPPSAPPTPPPPAPGRPAPRSIPSRPSFPPR